MGAWRRRTAQAGSPSGVLGAKVLHVNEVLFLYKHDEQVLETARYPVLTMDATLGGSTSWLLSMPVAARRARAEVRWDVMGRGPGSIGLSRGTLWRKRWWFWSSMWLSWTEAAHALT